MKPKITPGRAVGALGDLDERLTDQPAISNGVFASARTANFSYERAMSSISFLASGSSS